MENKKKKILIVSASYGTGHVSTAKYIAEHFSSMNDYEVLEIDILDYAVPFLGKLMKLSYNQSMRVPWLYNILYNITDNTLFGKVGAKILSMVIDNNKFQKVVFDFCPDLVIATHFTAATCIGRIKKYGQLQIPLISIITDYQSHNICLEMLDEFDAIIVSTEEEKKRLIERKIPANKIQTFGIPISSKYMRTLYDKNKLLKKFQLLGKKPIILFYGGGGNGSVTTLKYLKSLIKSKIDAYVFFICGRNQKLYRRAKELIKRTNAKNIYILGFILNGPEYLAVSDVVITKPGGITITECLAFKKAMILIQNSGGQEKYNAEFLINHGYALDGVSLTRFSKILKAICKTDTILRVIESNMQKFGNEYSMEYLSNYTAKLLGVSFSSIRSTLTEGAENSQFSNKKLDKINRLKKLREQLSEFTSQKEVTIDRIDTPAETETTEDNFSIYP